MKKLYSFGWDCGRQGELEGLFIAEESEVKNLIGKEVYFGEALGKHSEVFGDIQEGDIKELNVSQTTIEELEKAIGRKTISGYNPLDYIDGE